MKKDIFETIFLAIVFVFAGFRLYKKYFRKEQDSKGGETSGASKASQISRDDDYEPYLKK